jgi:hypothetical protein
MPEDDLHRPGRCDDGHDRWLAMQAAYVSYQRASEELARSHSSSDDAPPADRVLLAASEDRQRHAFEHYLESRLAFMECRIDEHRPGPSAVDRESGHSASASGLATVNLRTALEILALLLMFAIAFSLVRERIHIVALERAYDGTLVSFQEMRDGLRLLGQKVDAGHLQQPPVQQATLQLPNKQAAAPGKPAPATHRRTLVLRKQYKFSLAPSRQFQRVGPIQVVLRSMDAQRRLANLSILSDVSKTDVDSVHPNSAVWINVGRSQPHLELVVDRIAGNHLEGHLSEYQADLTQANDTQAQPLTATGLAPHY